MSTTLRLTRQDLTWQYLDTPMSKVRLDMFKAQVQVRIQKADTVNFDDEGRRVCLKNRFSF